MLDNEKARRIEMKKCLLIETFKAYLQDIVYDYVVNGNYHNIVELDQWLDERFEEYYDSEKRIKEFYEEQLKKLNS